jgi:hypothetical protein
MVHDVRGLQGAPRSRNSSVMAEARSTVARVPDVDDGFASPGGADEVKLVPPVRTAVMTES